MRRGIIFFCFFYTAVVFNPEETADNLKRYGGFIPGIRPGQATEDISRLRADPHHRRRRGLPDDHLPGAGVPDRRAGIPFYLGGTSLLIVVNVTMDTVTQIQSHLIAHQYGDLIKKSKLKSGARGATVPPPKGFRR
jgi:preprotein translocase subunit SecY